MQGDHLHSLKEIYNFDAWRDRSRLDQNLFIWQLFLSGVELPDYDLIRSQEIRLTGLPRMVQSVWQRSRDRTTLRLDILECHSREQAHEFLVRTLGGFQLPKIERLADDEAGDVAFAAGPAAIVSGRANLVVTSAFSSRAGGDLLEVVHLFDADLRAKPRADAPAAESASRIRHFSQAAPATKAFRVGDRVALDIQVESPADTELAAAVGLAPGPPTTYCKLFSPRTGQVCYCPQEERLVYQPDAPGSHTIELFAANADRSYTGQQMQLEIE